MKKRIIIPIEFNVKYDEYGAFLEPLPRFNKFFDKKKKKEF